MESTKIVQAGPGCFIMYEGASRIPAGSTRVDDVVWLKFNFNVAWNNGIASEKEW